MKSTSIRKAAKKTQRKTVKKTARRALSRKRGVQSGISVASKSRVVSVAQRQSAAFFTTIGFKAAGLPTAKERWRETKGSENELKSFLGGKAYGLLRMDALNIPVPPALNLSTQLCGVYLQQHRLGSSFTSSLHAGIEAMGRALSQDFGAQTNPLLVSVRSGARVSMPGMMDTVLNLGLNRAIVEAKVKEALKTNPQEARFWWDSYRRLIQMFSTVVLNLPHDLFEDALREIKGAHGIENDNAMSEDVLVKVVDLFESRVAAAGKTFPQDPWMQLELAVESVFRSWNTERAMHYRKIHSIPEEWGTSVTVQAMVFGNRNDQSATGVVFSRDPSTGIKKTYGEFLVNAQGEDVVAGIRTPKPIEELSRVLPKAHRELIQILSHLERELREVQDVEFTIDSGKLFILQTRTAKRSAAAALEHWKQLHKEGLLTKEEIVEKLSVDQVKNLLHPSLKPTDAKPLAQGLAASPGAVSGRIAFHPDVAVQFSRASQRVILVRRETSPEDIMGMAVSEGILTATGGMTSHAAVVARGMGKTCVVGCSEIDVHENDRLMTAGGRIFREGDCITIDGSTGNIYADELPTQAVKWSQSARDIFNWVDAQATLPVLANADTPEQAEAARQLGAKGIGLCRTEHMFFDRDRIHQFRLLILSEDAKQRTLILKSLSDYQQRDFEALFEVMESLSVCVRLLDPPLHEFLPKADQTQELQTLARDLGWTPERLQNRLVALHEANPMLGHRGCRLAVTFPEIYAMQVEALARAFTNRLTLKIMIPLVGFGSELAFILHGLKSVFESSIAKKDWLKSVQWGTMIELPRACLVADAIAKQVDFFSFGTNDLTQTALGLSRDDSSRFLPTYIEKGLLTSDPFESVDEDGVGKLMAMAVTLGRSANSKLDIGICGEHGGDPKSIQFFSTLGLNSVSCSPFRVPVARLAVAKSARHIEVKVTKKIKKKIGKRS